MTKKSKPLDFSKCPAFAWDGHCVYGDEASIKAVHQLVTDLATHVAATVDRENKIIDGEFAATEAAGDMLLALKEIQFGFNHVRCPSCAGWNGTTEKDKWHSPDCIVQAAIRKGEALKTAQASEGAENG